MPLPKKRKSEDRSKFMKRCMSSDVMKREFSDRDQRVAVCLRQAGVPPEEKAKHK